MKITAEEAQAAGLSQAEIDAINGVDEDQDDAALAEIAGDDDTNQEENDDADYESSVDDEEEEGSEADNADGGSSDGSGAEDSGAGESADDGEGLGSDRSGSESDLFAGINVAEVAFVPKLSGELLPQFAQAVEDAYDATDKQMAAIEAKFSAGDLDESERRAEIRKIERERDADIRKINAASTNAEIDGQRWHVEQQTFFRDNPEYNEPWLFNLLNAEVLRVANLPEASGKSGLQVLEVAKRLVDQQIEAAFAKRHGKAADTASQKQAASNKPKVPRPDVQTLGGLPAAAAADTGKDKWAHIDQLTGMAYEAALARMSDVEQAAYLASR